MKYGELINSKLRNSEDTQMNVNIIKMNQMWRHNAQTKQIQAHKVIAEAIKQ